MADYWFIFRIQLYGRDELVGRINYNCNHFMKEVVWKFLDWVKNIEDVEIKTYHAFRYPRNVIMFRINVEGEEIGADVIKNVKNNFRNRVDDYRQEGKREHFLGDDARADFNNEKALNAIAGAYGGLHALGPCLDFMNIMAELNRELNEQDLLSVIPEEHQSRMLHLVNFINKTIFGIKKTYPCICGNDIKLEKMPTKEKETEKIKMLGNRLLKFKEDMDILRAEDKLEVTPEDLANNYADLVFLTFGLYSIQFTCEKCGELLDIKIR